MQGPTFYSNIPAGNQQFAPAPVPVQPASRGTGRLRSQLSFLALFVVIVALIAAGMSVMQWSTMRTVTLGFPKPTVQIISSNTGSYRTSDSVQFSASGSGRDLSYFWDFGDGSTANGSDVSHIFGRAGSYTVVVTVVDAIDQSSRASVSVTILPILPTGTFTISYSYGYYVGFDASGSTSDPSTSIASYSWNFGDGSTDTTYTPSEYHYYNSSGPYTVTLVVTDAAGQESSAYSQTVYPQY
ncbi:MAG TPA: PKD domain-containing protein [Ktedonobacteraceae bacterium]|nr:PKD domain-containing protein [Ktedonobacteraceae bacterium]